MIIERNAAPPPSRSRIATRTATPGALEFGQLGVGDCLWIDVPPEHHAKPSVWVGCNRFRNAAYQYSKRTGRRMTVRIVDGRIGCWRVA